MSEFIEKIVLNFTDSNTMDYTMQLKELGTNLPALGIPE